jgi:hypothetical protein
MGVPIGGQHARLRATADSGYRFPAMRMEGGMTAAAGHAKMRCNGRGRAGADQARPVLLAILLLAACSPGQGPESIGPVFARITGPAFEGREPPPGTDQPFPNLGTIPARPAVADPAVRDALTAALAEDRQRSRNPLDPEMRPEPVRPAGTPGDRSLPLRPPGPAPIAAAPRVPWETPGLPPPAAPAALPQPGPAPAVPARPGPAAAPQPAAPPPVMGAAPPPPPPAELLSPGAPPPPPPAELLAPRTR